MSRLRRDGLLVLGSRRERQGMGDLGGSILLDASEFSQTLDRLSAEIVAGTAGSEAALAVVGIRTRGVPLGKRLAQLVSDATGRTVPLGVLDITLYRDDLSDIASQPIVRATDIPFAVDDRHIVLVDDVLYTGRTTRAAITALIDFGRPKKIELLVMVDRGGRELPIHADYVGRTFSVHARQMVQVHLEEEDGRDEVVLVEAGTG